MKIRSILSIGGVVVLLASLVAGSLLWWRVGEGEPVPEGEDVAGGKDVAGAWSAERREDLERMARLVAGNTQGMSEEERRDVLAMIREVISGGRGDVYTRDGISAAHLAAQMSMAELVQELVLRGADPNRSHSVGPVLPEGESVFQAAIACIWPETDDVERLSQAERQELLGWLLEHGADINKARDYSITLALIADSKDEWDKMEDSIPGGTLEWLLDHGLKPEGERARSLLLHLMSLHGSLPTVQKLVQKGYLDLHNAQDVNAMLKITASYPDEDSAAKARWLLSRGANAAEVLPTCCANVQLYGDTGEPDDAPAYNATLAVLDALLDYGARPENPARYTPSTEPQKSLYLDLLAKHHLLPAQDNK